ncbi:WASH complex subunit 3 [Dissostichus eleginoides]|uniref:WASH complex subunit 3 n=1 Tax=Dissostichus eleginoides TaxID=100907 RepID=A0AAD9F9J9_DISEL|nr:WASH complex subunit 3 [Dissostichus eleginoides]
MCSTSVGYSCTTSTSFSMVRQKLRPHTSWNINTMDESGRLSINHFTVTKTTLSCGSICVKVSQLRSLVGGRNRDDYGRTNREARENKHWKHGHEQNPAGSGAGPPCRHLRDGSEPRGHPMEPDTTTAVYKSRQSGRRRLEKHVRQEEEATNYNVVQRKRPRYLPIAADICHFIATNVLPSPLAAVLTVSVFFNELHSFIVMRGRK